MAAFDYDSNNSKINDLSDFLKKYDLQSFKVLNNTLINDRIINIWEESTYCTYSHDFNWWGERSQLPNFEFFTKHLNLFPSHFPRFSNLVVPL